METVSVDLWATSVQVPLENLDAWLARLEARVADASARGVHLLVLPEFSCAQWLSFAPVDLPPQGQLKWMGDLAKVAQPAIRNLAAQYGISILPGTIPYETTGAAGEPVFLNRAWLMTPQGAVHHQDKLSLTPIEANGTSGSAIAGDAVRVIDWNGLRLAIAICLDTEYTALWSLLGQLDLDLIVIPARTDMITGYNRVFTCARARAIELQTAICVVGAVGTPLIPAAQDTSVGGAAVFLPCDISVSLDGCFAALAAEVAMTATDRTLMAWGIPVAACRKLRAGNAEAEVRPALWQAAHLRVEAA